MSLGLKAVQSRLFSIQKRIIDLWEKKFPKSQLDAGVGDYAEEGKYEGKYC